MSADSPEQLQALRRVGRLVSETIDHLRRAVRPGLSTGALDRTAAVFRELTGHGIGRRMHEPPTVFSWPAPGAEADLALQPGLVLTIEPMLTAGRTRLVTEADGWTVSAIDGAPSAHEEHTIMIADGGPVVLTRR